MLHPFHRAAKTRNYQNGDKAVGSRFGRPSVLNRVVLESLENRRMLADILGAASGFAALGSTTVTNTGATNIVGNVGVSPGTSITGFPPGVVTNGSIHAGDAAATQAEADLGAAYAQLAGETANTVLSGQDLGGLTLTPGVYRYATSATMGGTLTLDAQGDANARFDIQIGTTLITGTNAAITLINGAQAGNVYFQVGSSATLGTNSALKGNILAFTSVTLDSGASLSPGRALGINGAITMDTNVVAVPDADVSVTNSTTAASVRSGGTISYTMTVHNAGLADAQTVAFSDAVPSHATFLSVTQTSGPAFTVTTPAVGGTGNVGGTISTLGVGASASFTIVARVASGLAAGIPVASTASVTSVTPDLQTSNNSASFTTPVGTTPIVATATTPIITPSKRPQLSVLGNDPGAPGESGLTYTWSVAHSPSGAKAPKFSINGTNAAKNATVRVQKDGTYLLNCLIKNAIGNSVTASVRLVITQVATSLRLRPHAQVIAGGASLQYGGVALDQFAHTMRTPQDLDYDVVSGDGHFSGEGLFSAGQTRGHVVIQITDGDLVGILGATIT